MCDFLNFAVSHTATFFEHVLTHFIRPVTAFHIETRHLFCSAKQMTGFYMKHNTGLKLVKQCL